MKKNRVNCANCAEFTFPNIEYGTYKELSPAKCNLGKRVMFRAKGDHVDDWGWFRYCEDFNNLLLHQSYQHCKEDNSSTEFMLEYMQCYACVDLDCVMNYLNKYHSSENIQ